MPRPYGVDRPQRRSAVERTQWQVQLFFKSHFTDPRTSEGTGIVYTNWASNRTNGSATMAIGRLLIAVARTRDVP